jgi:hypothetical protein
MTTTQPPDTYPATITVNLHRRIRTGQWVAREIELGYRVVAGLAAENFLRPAYRRHVITRRCGAAHKRPTQ